MLEWSGNGTGDGFDGFDGFEGFGDFGGFGGFDGFGVFGGCGLEEGKRLTNRTLSIYAAPYH